MMAGLAGHDVEAQNRRRAGQVRRTSHRARRESRAYGGTCWQVHRNAVPAPADPQADRLLKAPVFLLSPVRSGSTLLRALMNAHPALHVRRLRVEFGTGLAEQAMAALGRDLSGLEHLLWDRVPHRELVRSGKRFMMGKTPADVFTIERIAACWGCSRVPVS
ncbi:hypothetical protein ACIBK9_33865 [Nonomuraea sp. NPDC050227]|uniref:hypothetical protein n=1 Tax=Nonomuraea sp. NPDC050227 TaxID=3364360 RepID=UPI0037A2A464